jgi:uncharacterized membrane protein
MRRLVPALGTAFILALALSPASASLSLCNRTSYVIYAATAQASASGIDIKGWTRVVPGACGTAIAGDLAAQAYYLFARSARSHDGATRAWNGTTTLCAQDRDFRLHLPVGSPRCGDQNAYELGFVPLSTHHMRSWTTTLRETPDLPSMAAAERAGLKRLLGDVGYRDLSNDKAIDASLAQFRKRTHLPDKADMSAVFNALETEAMRSAAPAGYTVCNDTGKAVYAAVGMKKGNVYVSRGWWTVAGGSCAQVMTDTLAGLPLWLRVEREKGAPIVAGAMTFCVTNIEFEIQGRERCMQRGLTEAGFAETNVKRQPGYTAHVTTGGLRGPF